MTALLRELRKRGWVISESRDKPVLLPDYVRARYPSIPAEVADFLCGLERCHNPAENAWILTPSDFRKTDDEGFRWNEYELMALDSAQNDPAWQAEVRAFWNQHLPIMMAVHSDYDYLALRLAAPNFGAIVHGAALEWENPSIIAGSFQEFVLRFTAEAASSEPAFPYSVFL
jgi:hypothetical protein